MTSLLSNETTLNKFDDYLCEKKNEFHPKIIKLFNSYPKDANELTNLIFFGPPGIGKYTLALKLISKYSISKLKHEKNLSIIFNKQQYFLKTSDIHFEVDMSLLGCNPKLFWNEIFQQLKETVLAKQNKIGIILCKNFHEINIELLDIFYIYMQPQEHIKFKFILLTDELSFINENITNNCKLLNIPRPTKSAYQTITKLPTSVKIDNITNIKLLKTENIIKHEEICNSIIELIKNIKCQNLSKLRETIYDLFIYDLNIYDCIWYILKNLNVINEKILNETILFFERYNNNYRPISHVEKYLLFLSNCNQLTNANV